MTKISQLPAAASTSISDLLVTVNNGVTKRITDNQLATLFNNYIQIGIAQVTGLQTAINALQSDIQINDYTYAVDTGAADAYEVTLSPVPSGYVNGLEVNMYTTNTNVTRDPTIDVNGLGAIDIFSIDGYKVNIGDIGDTVSRLVFSADINAFVLTNPVTASTIATKVPDNEFSYGVATSVANAYTGTTKGLGAFPKDGTTVYMQVDASNTGASTLNVVNADATPTGNWAIRFKNAALTGGEMIAGETYAFTYRTGNVWQLMNPSFMAPKTFAGDPNTNVAGFLKEFCIDTANSFLYYCTTAGNAASAVWTKIVV